MLNKRGQFYLVAAIIIVMVVMGLIGVTSYTFPESNPPIIYELDSELNQEGASIVDYGIYTGDTSRLQEFIKNNFSEYFLQKTEEIEIAFVYGSTSEGVYLTTYNTTDRGKISLSMGGSAPTSKIVEKLVDTTTISEGDIEVTLLGTLYNFSLKPGENFYFIIGYEKDGEVFIEKNSKEIIKV